jgi:uncharacterized protein (TIGR01777 family)
MRILITGGTGLIGMALTASLAADGHEVIVLTRDPAKATGLPRNARAEKWDARTAQGWGALADGADTIINLAGESIAGESIPAILFKHWSAAYKQQIVESRKNGGQAIVEAVRAAKQKPRVLIQASAVGYYGPRGAEEITEATGFGADFTARTCQAWEASTAEVETLGVRRVVIRTGVVLSTAGGVLPMVTLPFKFFAGGPLGNGKQWFPWIHMADEVNAIRFLVDNPQASGAFNLCAPTPVTNAQLSRAVGQALRRPSFMPVPGFALQLVLGEKAAIVLNSQRQLPHRLQASGFQFKYPTIEGALKNLTEDGGR